MAGGGLGLIGSILSAVSSFAFAPSAPSVAPVPTFAPPPEAPEVEDEAVSEAQKAEQKRRRAAGGIGSTILTSGAGVEEEALTSKKTLLGE